ncbi:hypothetical protein F3Y22_tig00110548pilonHSYRG00762 [Hibiscus syriacus]|uniref:OTU domain-containing protein n=1 Tax=Hibiscus syriacus TaxID=106335 RepID=A0A6A3AA60_HIBSY|nr:hypothetical protein F3Y22_tig00110548pilonHSYRG00762 [Hibiscus syriacus]
MSEGHGNASASSSSSLNSSFQDTEDDQAMATFLAEEENLHNNGKLGKRLSHLDSIPMWVEFSGLVKLGLATYGLAELQIEGDGNCQFRALADQLFRNRDYHKHIRRQIVKQFGAKICRVTSFRDTCYIEIMAKQASPTRGRWYFFVLPDFSCSDPNQVSIEGNLIPLSFTN